jgi:hypothetical protein
MKQIRWLRILVGGFLSELAVFAVFIPATVLLGEVPGMYTAVGASLVMPFLFGIWTTRKVKSYLPLQGMLVGAVGALIYVGLTRGQPEPLMYIVAHGLKLLGGAAGGYVVQKRRERDLLITNHQAV